MKATKLQRRAQRRNWAIYVARGMLAKLHIFKPLLDEPNYNRLENVLNWLVIDLERTYPWRDK